jgi:hypothetical protein
MSKDAATIAGECRTEANRLLDRVTQLLHIAAILEPDEKTIPKGIRIARERQIDQLLLTEAVEAEVEAAPYGYKADGTPYKRRPYKKRRKRAMPELDAHRETKLKVLSSTHPTPTELRDRELVHTTEQPAMTGANRGSD